MARPVGGLSVIAVKIIQAIQDGASHKVAVLNAVVGTSSTDIKKPLQRAKKKIRDARFSEAIRSLTKEERGILIMGERLYPLTPELERFANIDEPHLCFYEHLLSQGWELDKDGTLFNPKDREGSKE